MVFRFIWATIQEIFSFFIPFLPKVPLARVDTAGGFYIPETPAREDFIYTKTWPTEGTPKAILVAVHGLGEHIGRYEHVFKEFAKNGIQTIGLDLHGFGRSTGRRGAPPSLQEIFNTIELIRNLGRKEGIKTFLFGHSMGGFLALSYCIERKGFDGVIASAPAIGVAYKVPKILDFLALVLGKAPVLKKITAPNGIPLSGISRDPAVIEKYKSDPLVHDKISPQLGSTILEYSEKMRTSGIGSRLTLPILIAHGDQDHLTSFGDSEAFIKTVSSTDATFIPYKGLYHELHNEPEKEVVIRNYVEWILARA